jgi:hypothetical protein
MDIEDAKRLTRLCAREFPDTRFEFLRCQLGDIKIVPTKVSVFKTVNESIFCLRFFGETWEEAVSSWQLAQKQAAL